MKFSEYLKPALGVVFFVVLAIGYYWFEHRSHPEAKAIVGAPASPQAGPMLRIAINNEIELDAEVPSIHMLKLNPGATVRISRDNAPDLVGRVRLVSPQIDRSSQLGHVRIALTN